MPTPPRFQAKLFFDPGSEALRHLPEGPRVLRTGPGILGWVAIQHASDAREGSLNVLDLATLRNHSLPLPGRPGFFAETTRPGVVLVGLERRLVLVNIATGAVEEMGTEVTSDARVIINDGLAIEGGVLFGTKHLEFNQPIAALYHFDAATRRVHTVVGGQLCSNGKFVQSRDATGMTLIDTDTIPKAISRYRLDAGLERVLERTPVTPPEALPAFPDGLRPSPDGQSIVVAYYNPEPVADGLAQQLRLSDGAVLCEWTIPGSPRVTCPEFLEMDGKVKVIFTTAVEGMPDAIRRLAPNAGCMFIAGTPFDRVPSPPPRVAL